jgi:uncharacterized repeat protein (TIGR01451 family)
MKVKRVFIPFVLGWTLIFALFRILEDPVPITSADGAADAPVAELEVCPSGCAYSSVQDAVDAANPGDIIKVATGVYNDIHRVGLGGGEYITQLVRLRETVTIRGGYTTTNWSTPNPDAYPATLDAGGQGRVFYIETGIQPVIEGLRIVGGNAIKGDTDQTRRGRGGGVYATGAALTFRNNHVSGNTASWGGGLYLRAGNVTLDGNTATTNTADYGGGLFLNESAVSFTNNWLSANTANVNGGGLLLFQSDRATFNNNAIIANVAQNGGGLYLDGSDATLTNNVIADNDVGAAGAGLYIQASSLRLLHTAVARNSGNEGIYAAGSSDVESVNTILVSHTVGINITMDSAARLDATLWHANDTNSSGGVVHTNDRSGAPDFDAPNAGDYHIGNLSAALDQGVDAGVSKDMDGEDRPRGHGYDIGPDEYPDLLSVVKQGDPIPARAGEQLVYTIIVANYSDEIYTAAITDILPNHITFTEIVTSWTSQTIYPDPGNPWIRFITVTVEARYNGPLTNTVEVTTQGDETGSARLVTGCYAAYLPLVLRNS